MQKISVPSRLWHGNQERELTFPDRWEIHNLDSPGFRKPGLTSLEIKEKIDHPWKVRRWRNWPGLLCFKM
jgi:hypothetical protein